MWEYNYNDNFNDELSHHGIKGMKWGVRRYQNADGSLTPAGEKRYAAKNDYKSASKDYRAAVKEQRYASNKAFGIQGLKDYKKAEQKTLDADINRSKAKAEYAKAKAKTDEKGEKAEFKSYVKSIGKTGLEGSYSDRMSGGRSTAMLDDLRTRKGEEYASRVEKKIQSQAIAKLVGGIAVSVGSAVVAGILAANEY